MNLFVYALVSVFAFLVCVYARSLTLAFIVLLISLIFVILYIQEERIKELKKNCPPVKPV